ncbi:MAG TPA: RNA polymerase sigma factor [Candidatus Binatia bacterium]|jgi:RNA polymerase sigma factor (sigma-70 family)|nr:RNA polymerase sigma factor [Candidatus Binatia bacterium]
MDFQNSRTDVNEPDYEQAVSSFYESLYGFAYSLTGNENDACELTQETFARLLTKGGQVRDHTRLKSWLFTALYRVFLGWKNREARLPHLEISTVEHELPFVTAEMADTLENDTVREALLGINERYRVPLILYYLEEHSYTEIAEILDIPIGTVMSRLSRAKALMRESLAAKGASAQRKIVPLDQQSKAKQS